MCRGASPSVLQEKIVQYEREREERIKSYDREREERLQKFNRERADRLQRYEVEREERLTIHEAHKSEIETLHSKLTEFEERLTDKLTGAVSSPPAVKAPDTQAPDNQAADNQAPDVRTTNEEPIDADEGPDSELDEEDIHVFDGRKNADYGAYTAAEAEDFMSGKPWKAAALQPDKQLDACSLSDHTLRLKFVHGYRGHDSFDNVHHTASGELVYPAGALVVVYDKQSHSQQFYTEHTDDILSCTVNPAGTMVATGEVGRSAAIHIWDPATLETVHIISGVHQCAVVAMRFSHDGKKLASVDLSEEHKIAVINVESGEVMASTAGVEEKIFNIAWSGDNKFMTAGIQHCSVWTHDGSSLLCQQANYGKFGTRVSQVSVASISSGLIVTGARNGNLYVWNNQECTQMIKSAHKGTIASIFANDRHIITGGRDGKLRFWTTDLIPEMTVDVKLLSDKLLDAFGRRQVTGGGKVSIRAISQMGGKIVVGTFGSEIMEIDDNSAEGRVLVQGHALGEMLLQSLGTLSSGFHLT